MKNVKLLFLNLLFVAVLSAHPSPNTLILLDIQSDGVSATLQIPASELGMVFNASNPKTAAELMGNFADSLKTYLLSHITPVSMDGQKWSVTIQKLYLEQVNPKERNTLEDITVQLWLKPPTGASNRQFILNYDVVMHQVVTHSALVSIQQDWETGVVAEHPVQVGVINVEPRNNQIFPLSVSLENRGLWGGFLSMVGLGRKHIAEGTDHLLFLLVLLLAAPLLVSGKKWGDYGGLRYALMRLLKIITAFTIGHSLTLLAGAVGWLRVPSQPIEVLIAFSILVSAIHAIRPIFHQREIYVAAGFGLIHGLAFASTLSALNLNATAMMLSILGFNIGIELQQLLVVLLTVPFLILLSKQPKIYDFIRVGGALLAAIAALAWMIERISGNNNAITAWMNNLFTYGEGLILTLMVFSLGVYFLNKEISNNSKT